MDLTQQLIVRVVRYLAPHCEDRQFAEELLRMATDRATWRYGHALFGRIRDKSLQLEKAEDTRLFPEFSFLEIAAKTLFNLSDHFDPMHEQFPYPFDAHAQLWFVPLAIEFANSVGAADFLPTVFAPHGE
jgi:hypothetical protein